MATPNPRKVGYGRGVSWETTYRVTPGTAAPEDARGRRGRAGQGAVRDRGRRRRPDRRQDHPGRVHRHVALGLQVRDGTKYRYQHSMRRYVLPHLGSRPMAAIRRFHVVAAVQQLSKTHLVPSTVNSAYPTLMVMRSAVDDRLITFSPCYRLRLLEVQPKPLAVFTPDQARDLLASTRPQEHAVIALAPGAGLRQGEALGLRLEAPAEAAARAGRRRAVPHQPGGSTEITRELKTAISRWVLPLPRSSLTRWPGTSSATAWTTAPSSGTAAAASGDEAASTTASRRRPCTGPGSIAATASTPAADLRLQPHPRMHAPARRLGPAQPRIHRRDHGHLRAPVPRGQRGDPTAPSRGLYGASHSVGRFTRSRAASAAGSAIRQDLLPHEPASLRGDSATEFVAVGSYVVSHPARG